MRDCQPGPVALQRSMTSTGRRMEMSFFGLADSGRPAFLTTARARASSVSSGNSLYSLGRITCASTLAKFDLKPPRDLFLFTLVCLSHAEYPPRIPSLRVPDYHEATIEEATTFSRPFKISMMLYKHTEPNAELLEYKCVEFSENLLYGEFLKVPPK